MILRTDSFGGFSTGLESYILPWKAGFEHCIHTQQHGNILYVLNAVPLRINAQMLLSVIMLVSIETIIFMSCNTLQSLPNWMEYTRISEFECKRAAVKLSCQSLTQNVRHLNDDSSVPSTSKFSCSKFKLPQLLASRFGMLSNQVF